MIKIERIDRSEAFRYLGYKGNSVPDDKINELADICEKELLSVIQPKLVYRVFHISENNGDSVRLTDCGFSLDGKDISEHLAGCEKAVLMACTLSAGTDRVIRKAEVTDMTKAFIMDAMASAATEQVCNAAEEEIFANVTGYFRTWRFSPGYGDFPIDVQRDFLEILKAPKQIGLCANESSLLTPRKSVTAVIGLSETEIPRKKRGCGSCRMKDTCAFRRRGDRCEF